MRYAFLMILISITTGIATTVLVVNLTDLKLEDLLETLEVHVLDPEILYLDRPTFGEINWRLRSVEERLRGDLMMVFLGRVLCNTEDCYLMLSDSNEEYPRESALSLSRLERTLKPHLIAVYDGKMNTDTLRKIAWKGFNILVLPSSGLSRLVYGLRGGADSNEDGTVSFEELLRFMSEGSEITGFSLENTKITLSTQRLLEMAFSKILKLTRSGKLDVESALKILKISLTGDWEDLRPVMEFGLGRIGLSDLLSHVK